MALRVALLAALASRALAATETCEPDSTKLKVLLFDGVVRDMDPAPRDLGSDPICFVTVGGQEEATKILLNTNAPDFEAFLDFGCQARDAPFSMVCYDSDQPFAAVNSDSQVVFEPAPLDAWPESGVKVRLLDAEDPQYVMHLSFVYGSNLDADGVPTAADGVPTSADGVPPSSKKSRRKGGVVPVVVFCAFLLAAFALGGLCCCFYVKKTAKSQPELAEASAVELADVSVLPAKGVEVTQPSDDVTAPDLTAQPV